MADGNGRTCPASRHAMMIAEDMQSKRSRLHKLLAREGYEPGHMGESIASTVESLWHARQWLAWENGHWIPDPAHTGSKPMGDLIERLRQMEVAGGLVQECLERATYLHAMEGEGLSTIERQSMETLYKAADALESLQRENERLREALGVIAYEQPEDAWCVAHDALKATAVPLAAGEGGT